MCASHLAVILSVGRSTPWRAASRCHERRSDASPEHSTRVARLESAVVEKSAVIQEAARGAPHESRRRITRRVPEKGSRQSRVPGSRRGDTNPPWRGGVGHARIPDRVPAPAMDGHRDHGDRGRVTNRFCVNQRESRGELGTSHASSRGWEPPRALRSGHSTRASACHRR